MAGQERRERVHRVINTRILRESELDILEDNHRTVGAITLKLTRKGEANSIMERQTKGLMDVLATLVLEQVRLKVVCQRKECTTLETKKFINL